LDFLSNHIEALIFASPKPIKKEEIRECLMEMFDAEVPEKDIENAISGLIKKFDEEDFSFQIEHLGGGYQFLTKPAYQASIGILLKQQSKKRLSNSSLETLSIIAYKQPVTKSQIEQIRGVNCDYTIQKLLEKELIDIRGKAESIGRPILYGTSDKFMEYFGINDLNELPTPKDFSHEENTIGEEKTEE
jgi:segregation and condensation protein B